jgi:predicted dehydrogenase
MLGLRAGDAVLAVDCDQRFTLAASAGAAVAAAALERRRGRGEAGVGVDVEADGAWWWWWSWWWWWWWWSSPGTPLVWGGSELLALALVLAAACLCLEAERWTVTRGEWLWRRRCEVGAGLLDEGSAASRGTTLMLRAVR